MQANWQTMLLNYSTNAEVRLPNITKAQKTYPASGAIAMLPLTVENKFTPTLLFCGGMDPVRDESVHFHFLPPKHNLKLEYPHSWNNKLWAIAETKTSNSCVSINPMDATPTWVDDDDLAVNRVSPQCTKAGIGLTF